MRGRKLLQRKIQSAVLVGTLGALGATAFGTNGVWLGGTADPNSYNIGSNWSIGHVPSAFGDGDAIINLGPTDGVAVANINATPSAQPGNLTVGASGTGAVLNISGGSVAPYDSFNVGVGGTGVVNQSGGTVVWGQFGGTLNIGTGTTGNGTYAMTGTALINPTNQNIDIGGGAGGATGLMTLADSATGGGTPINLSGTNGIITIGVGGTLSGFGTVVSGSNTASFINNGRIIGNGGTLTLPSGTNNLFNTTAENTNGNDGVFATNGGQVVVTSGHLASGTNNYTAFDAPGDTAANMAMVNSVNYSLSGAAINNQLTTAVKAAGRPDFASLWSLEDNGSYTSSTSTITFRYDNSVVGSGTVQLYENTGAGWVQQTGATLNTSNYTLTLTNPGTAFANGATAQFAAVIPGVPSTWIGSGTGGDYNASGNWTLAGVPNGIDQVANFTNPISSDQVVFTTTNVTLGEIVFNSSVGSYAFTGGVHAALTLQTSSLPNALVNVQAGTHEINIPLTLASNTTFNVANAASLIIADPMTINSNIALTTTTAGTGTVTYESTVTLDSGATMSIASSTYAHALTLLGNAAATIPANTGTKTVLKLDSLSIPANGNLDVNNNEVVVNGGNLSSINAQVASGYNGGTGIISTAAQTDASGLHALGVAPVGNAVEVKYTYYGDADLDGSVTGNDYTIIDTNNGLTSGALWSQGDFNYDGKVDGSDYSLIDNTFNQQGANIAAEIAGSAAEVASAGAGSAVPEPGSIALLGCAVFGLIGRRRRSH